MKDERSDKLMGFLLESRREVRAGKMDLGQIKRDMYENTVTEALRAGIYAGQTKPLRSYGMDITESSLQPILNDLNIKNEDGTIRTVRELSQAEKQIVRYSSIKTIF